VSGETAILRSVPLARSSGTFLAFKHVPGTDLGSLRVQVDCSDLVTL